MKKLAFLTVVIILVIAYWLYKNSRQVAEHFSDSSEQTTNVVIQTHTATNTGGRDFFPHINLPDTQVRRTKWESTIEAVNVRIDFWGKVIDQDGSPLTGVVVTASTRAFSYQKETKGSMPPGLTIHSITNTISDVNGLFEFQGLKGDSFKIESMDKEGYEVDPGVYRGFSYDPSHYTDVSPNNPFVFRLWRKGLKQSLIENEKVYPIMPDGRTYVLEITKGSLEEATSDKMGDILIQLKREEGAQRRKPYDWSIAIRTKEGGLLKEDNAQYLDMALAPVTGYTNNFESVHKASDIPWNDVEWQDRFYIKSGSNYGRLQLNINSFYDPDTGKGRLQLQYSINPTGSRILR
jgi:hypothetical protein